MVDQLSVFAFEVARVALEVGTDGILGGLGAQGKQVNVDVEGKMLDLKLTVNSMLGS